MVTVKEQTFNKIQVAELLAYHFKDDDRTDTRDTVRSKHPRWHVDKWPQHVIEPLINDNEYVEEVIYNESTISFQIHVDSGYNNQSACRGIIIPLVCEAGSTVFFNNYWKGDAAKFVRSEDPYQHVKDSHKQITTKDQRITNYTKIINYTDQPFDKEIYNQYLTHIPYENLHGLTVDTIVSWSPGDIIVFDRNQLHCASNEHDHKIGMTVFTNLL